MQAYFSAVAKAFPKSVGPAWQQIETQAATKPLDQVRLELQQKRFEYWFRKLNSAGSTWSQAKKDWVCVSTAMKSPGDLTYKQIATGGVWAVHVAGSFCIGEMIARGSIAGYKVGAANLPGAGH